MESQSYAANCGLFWVANSVVSTIMGTTNRSLHEEAAQRNLDFQRELEDARNIAQDEVEAEKIAFKRRVMKLSRQYRQAESAEMFALLYLIENNIGQSWSQWPILLNKRL